MIPTTTKKIELLQAEMTPEHLGAKLSTEAMKESRKVAQPLLNGLAQVIVVVEGRQAHDNLVKKKLEYFRLTSQAKNATSRLQVRNFLEKKFKADTLAGDSRYASLQGSFKALSNRQLFPYTIQLLAAKDDYWLFSEQTGAAEFNAFMTEFSESLKRHTLNYDEVLETLQYTVRPVLQNLSSPSLRNPATEEKNATLAKVQKISAARAAIVERLIRVLRTTRNFKEMGQQVVAWNQLNQSDLAVSIDKSIQAIRDRTLAEAQNQNKIQTKTVKR